MTRRIVAVAVMLVLYMLSVLLGACSFPAYQNASGVEDLGHLVVPSLLVMVGKEATQYIFWLGTLPLELFFLGICFGSGTKKPHSCIPESVKWASRRGSTNNRVPGSSFPIRIDPLNS